MGKRKRADMEADNLETAKLQEYLKVMQPRSKSRIWANEESIVTNAPNECVPSAPSQVIDQSKNDKDYGNIPKMATKPRMTEQAGGELPLNSKFISEADVFTNRSLIVDEVLQLPVHAPPPSDEDWLRSRTSKLLDLVEDGDAKVDKIAERAVNPESSMNKKVEDSSIQADETRCGSAISVAPLKSRDDTSNASGRLFVRNLPYTATEEELKGHFESLGPTSIIEVSLAENSQVW